MLIYGNEPYRLHQEKRKFISQYVNEDDALNISVYKNKVDMDEAKSIANSYPFFSDYRVIVFDHTDILKTDIVNFLETVPETTKLLFIEDAVDKKYKSYKWLSKNDQIIICDKLKNDDLIKWIQSFAALDAAYLIQKVGNDMYRIQNEIEKLQAYCDVEYPMSNEIIDLVCSDVAEDKVFDMIDAISVSDNVTALRLYSDLLELHTPAMKTLSLIRRHFGILQHIQLLNGKDNKTIAGIAGVQPWLIPKYKLQANMFSSEQLKRINEELLNVDVAIKHGNMKDVIALETSLCNLLTIKKGA